MKIGKRRGIMLTRRGVYSIIRIRPAGRFFSYADKEPQRKDAAKHDRSCRRIFSFDDAKTGTYRKCGKKPRRGGSIRAGENRRFV